MATVATSILVGQSPLQAEASRSAERHLAVVTGQLRDAQARNVLPALPPLQQAISALAKLETAGAEALAGLLEFLASLKAPHPHDALAEYLETHLQLGVIEALAEAAAHQPSALSRAYRATQQALAKDGLCEAAAKLAASRPEAAAEVMPMMLDHLEENAFVASLCLAESGNPTALPHLQARLRLEVLAPPVSRGATEAQSLRALHVEGLVEGIEALGGRVDDALIPLVARASARGRHGIAPLLALGGPSEAPRS